MECVVVVLGLNSALCGTCGKWCHKRCSGLNRLSAAAVRVVGEVIQFCLKGNIKSPGKQGYSSAPTWKGKFVLHKICYALHGGKHEL